MIMKKEEQEKYVEMMEMKTNKAARDIIQLVHRQGLDPQASIVSMLKASAILIESFSSVGGNGDSLETLVKEMIGPAREEARMLLSGESLDDVYNN